MSPPVPPPAAQPCGYRIGMPTAIPQDVATLLQTMVRINTVNRGFPDGGDGEAELVAALETVAKAYGLDTLRLPVAGHADQLLVTYEVDPGDAGSARPWMLFDSHLDTVSAAGMTIDPFAAELRDGKVWGRGACDTKGTGAAMLWAMKRYAQTDAAAGGRPNNVALLFSVDEEISMRGVASFVSNDLPTLGWKPAAAVVGEPTELRPVVAHNGCLRWSITTHGRACHSSVPHEGVSAISAMVRVIDRIEREYIPSLTAEHPLTGPAVCSINLIQGGTGINIIPEACSIQIDRRIVPGEDTQEVLREINALLEPLTQGPTPVRYTQQIAVDHPPATTRYNGAWVEQIQSVLADQGLPTLALGAPFATHAAYFDAARLPAVVLGPGSPHPAHTRDEWVAVDQIERGVTLYEALMRTPLPDPTR